MHRHQIEEKVHLVLEKFATTGGGGDSKTVLLLNDGGSFDSVTALEIILELERQFDVVIRDEEVCAQNLESFEAIARFIETKLSS